MCWYCRRRRCYGTARHCSILLRHVWVPLLGCHGRGAACLPPGATAGCHGHLAGRCAMAGCDIGAMVVCLGAILGGWHVCTHFGVLHIKVTLPDASVSKNKESFVLSGVCFGVSYGVPFFTCVETQN